MKLNNRKGTIATIAVLGMHLMTAPARGGESAAFKDQKGKISYGVGVGVARDLKQRGVDIDVDEFIKGLRDVLSGGALKISEPDLKATMSAYEQELRARQEQADKINAEENRKSGEAFLTENAKRDGVTTLASGLQYKVLTDGKGKKPLESDSVAIKYRGMLIDGKEFDRSHIQGQPSIFAMASVLPGMREALLLMNTGSKWQIVIPSKLGFGERKMRDIGPNSTLIFEVELVGIMAKSQDPAKQQEK